MPATPYTGSLTVGSVAGSFGTIDFLNPDAISPKEWDGNRIHSLFASDNFGVTKDATLAFGTLGTDQLPGGVTEVFVTLGTLPEFTMAWDAGEGRYEIVSDAVYDYLAAENGNTLSVRLSETAGGGGGDPTPVEVPATVTVVQSPKVM